MIDDVIIAPAERYIVEVLYSKSGTYPILHRGEKIGEVVVNKSNKQSQNNLFQTFRDNSQDYSIILDNLSNLISKKADKSLRLNIEMGNMMGGRMPVADHSSMMRTDISNDDAIREHCQMMPEMRGCEEYLDDEHESDGIEWEDEMAMMNTVSTDENIEWQIIDEQTGRNNMDINWSFKKGDLVKN